MLYNGEPINKLMIFKDGTNVPKYWLSAGGLSLLGFAFALGLPVVGKYCLSLHISSNMFFHSLPHFTFEHADMEPNFQEEN